MRLDYTLRKGDACLLVLSEQFGLLSNLVRSFCDTSISYIWEKEAGAGHSESYRWRRSDFPPRRILRIHICVPSTYKYTYMWHSKLNCCRLSDPWRRAVFQKIPGSLPLFSKYIIPRIFWFSQFWSVSNFCLPTYLHSKTLPVAGRVLAFRISSVKHISSYLRRAM